MQERQLNRKQYFKELAVTSRKYFIPYIQHYKKVSKGMKILEIGCGDGGNLLPFSQMGCEVVGCDMAECRVEDARRFFEEEGASGRFIASDVFLLKDLEHQFDLIICPDVIEHILDKQQFLHKCKNLLSRDGIIFMSFPAWQMPFGGHQQICKNKVLSHLPFFHLLPSCIYKLLLRLGHESNECIHELLTIKQTKCPVELFESVAKKDFKIINWTPWLINPHYEIKFGLTPRKLPGFVGHIPYVRNFFTTSSFYILTQK